MDVKLPKLGEGADSGTVVSIFVKEGDPVAKGQTLLELENEKAVAPIPSPAAGTVAKIRVREGDKLSVGQVILVLTGDETAQAETPAPVSAKAVPAARPPAPGRKAAVPAAVPPPDPELADSGEPEELPAPSGFAPPAAPTVRKIARELGLDLTRIRGSERGGRIVMADLKAHIARLQQLAVAKAAPATTAVAPAAAPPKPEPIDFAQWGSVTRKPMTGLRKIISRRMSESWNTIPQVTQFDEADVTGLLALRKKHGAAYEAKGGKLTLTVFTLKAITACLKQHPIFNASLDEATDEIVFKDHYHLGVAVDTEAGLIVPVIRDVDKKSLLQLAQELQELAEKTRDRKVSAEALKGGTFTLSNQGGIGGAHFTPIINKPEVAILGLGKGALKPVVRQGKIEARTLLPLGLSYDHRLIDGGAAARFVTDLVAALENFTEADVRL